MGHVIRTPHGTYRANWRDESGRQKAKSFPTKKEASAFLAQVEAALHRGLYVDPHAGRQAFGPYAERWLAGRSTERTTAARDASILKTNVLPDWEAVPLGRIDHSSVQAWIGRLSKRLAPSTVQECFRILNQILRSAVRDRIIGANPCEGVRVPKRRRKDTDGMVLITPDILTTQLLPALPARYRGLAAVAGGCGLRWGECIGLRWDAVDLKWEEGGEAADGTLRVIRTAVEVAGKVTIKPFPKSRAGRRAVPIPAFVADAIKEHHDRFGVGPGGLVFTNTEGGLLSRGHFRSRIWRPALVRAGLLGQVAETGPDRWKASWPDADGMVWSAEFTTEREAVAHVLSKAHNPPGLRFHDLRHAYATWLVSRGLPVNDVQRVMGHERPSTTLELYTHDSGQADGRIRRAFAEDPLTEDD